MHTNQQNRMARPRTRVELAAAEVEREKTRHRQIEKRHKTYQEVIESRIKLDQAIERLEQEKRLENPPPAPAAVAIPAPPAAIAPALPRKPACPRCGGRESSVNGTKGAVRNRKCSTCGESFTTFESVKS